MASDFRSTVLVFDTSILCVWLEVPGKEECGPQKDRWNFDRVNKKIEEAGKNRSVFVLPMAALIETGNHISQIKGAPRYKKAKEFVRFVHDAIDGKSPWVPFMGQGELWKKESLKSWVEDWGNQVQTGLSMGDASIQQVADFYNNAGYCVEIFTGDAGLKSREPGPSMPPRRRAK